jgi:Ca2+-binding RTX toxin-like protein
MSTGNLNRGVKLAYGKAWPGEGNSTVITYRFPTVLPGYYTALERSPIPDPRDNSNPLLQTPGLFGAFEAGEINISLDAFYGNSTGTVSGISDFSRVEFVPATAASDGDLSLFILNIKTENNGSFYGGVTSFAGYSENEPRSGDIMITLDGATRSTAFLPGSVATGEVASWNIAHEIGHALGLAHPQDLFYLNIPGFRSFFPVFSAAELTTKYSIMSYSIHPQEKRMAYEYQLYDIASLQYTYGRNDASNSGTTSYVDFDETPTVSGERYIGTPGGESVDRRFSIWDGGGVDTIDASLYAGSAYIDLRPGHFSSIGPNALRSTGDSPLTDARINDNGTVKYDTRYGTLGTENISIAFGADIEDARGGSANDVIIGNLHTNFIHGGGNNDLLFGDGFAVDEVDAELVRLGRARTGLVADLPTSRPANVPTNVNLPINVNVPQDADYRRIIRGGMDDRLIDPTQQLDALYGGDGNDLIGGSRGDDYLDGGDNDDTLFGLRGDDVLVGGDGADRLYGGDGGDVLRGDDDGTTRDYLRPGSLDGRVDKVYGGAGDVIEFPGREDQLYFSGVRLRGGPAVEGANLLPDVLDAGLTVPTPLNAEFQILNMQAWLFAEPSAFKGLDGFRYHWNRDSDQLDVIGAAGTLRISGFRNGDGGIVLSRAAPRRANADRMYDPIVLDLDGDGSDRMRRRRSNVTVQRAGKFAMKAALRLAA